MNNKKQSHIKWLQNDIDVFYSALSSSKNINTFQEEILNLIINIEERVRQIINKDRNKEHSAQDSEKIFNRYLSLFDINLEYKWVDGFLDDAINRVKELLKEKIIYLDNSIFNKENERNTWEWENAKDSEEENNYKEIEVQKFNSVLKALFYFWINLWDIKIYEETLTNNKIRKIPYRIIIVNTNNFKKTILVSDQKWEASFVYNWIIRAEKFENAKKSETINGITPITINFYTEKQFLEDLIEALASEKILELTKENIIKELVRIYWNWNTELAYENLVNLKNDKIRKLTIAGNFITEVVNHSDFSKDSFKNFDPRKNIDFKIWISWLLNKKEDMFKFILERKKQIKLELKKQAILRALIDDIWGWDAQFTFEILYNYTKKDIDSLKIGENYIKKIVNQSFFPKDGFENFYFTTPRDFKIWLTWLFDKDEYLSLIEEKNFIDNLDKETIVKELIIQYWDAETAYNELLKISITKFNMRWVYIKELVNKSQFDKEQFLSFNPQLKKYYKIWLARLFDRNEYHKLVEENNIMDNLNKESIVKILVKQHWDIETAYNESLKTYVRNFNINWIYIIELIKKSLFDTEQYPNFSPRTQISFKIWLDWLFDK